MAVETTNAFSGPFIPNGATTTFPFTFTAPSGAEVAAVFRSPDGTEVAATGFAVNLTPGGGGSVVFDVAPAAGPELYILLDPHFTQQIQFENGSGWLAEPVNEVADRSAARDQVLRRDVGRAIRVPLGEESPVLPPASQRANKFQGYDALGRPIGMPGTGADEGLREALADPDIGGALLATPDGRTAADVFKLLLQADVTLGEFTDAVQSLAWPLGFVLDAPIYGGSKWVVRSEIILQNHFAPQLTDSSKVDFDGPLEVVVPLEGGGFGMLDCDLGSIQGFVQRETARLRAEAMARFDRKISLLSVGSVYCYGTSLTYGQINTPQAGEDTGFGDGSQHVWEQAVDPWPAIAQSFSSEILGADKLSFVNRGFSGDRAGNAYRRHRNVAVGASLISVIEFGTNDALYATDNGDYPEGLFEATPGGTSNENGSYTFDTFVTSLRRFVYREVVRGSLPVLVGPYSWIGSIAYDGTDTAMGKIGSPYREAHQRIADEIGTAYVDGRDIINTRDLDTMTTDGLHLADGGRNVFAAGIVAAIFGAVHGALRISGPTKVAFLPHDAPINGPADSGADDIVMTPNGNTLGRPYTTPANGADNVLLAGKKRYLFVYLDCDEMCFIPVGYIVAGGTLTINVDFGATQGKAKLNTKRGAALGDFVSHSASVDKVNGTGGTIIVNYAGNAPILTVVGRGFHVIGLTATTQPSVISGLSADPAYGLIAAAIADASTAHALNVVFSDVEVETALNALGTKLNAVLAALRDRGIILP